jgi:methylated-DNA-protein-cysteine methyltransferase-like protein
MPKTAPTTPTPPQKGPNTRQAIYQAVQQIPKGKVATYGQIARLAGIPNGARQVGYALAALDGANLFKPDQPIPWQRVVNRMGEISYSFSRGGGDDLQRLLLESEGIVFDAAGKIDLGVYLWGKE